MLCIGALCAPWSLSYQKKNETLSRSLLVHEDLIITPAANAGTVYAGHILHLAVVHNSGP